MSGTDAKVRIGSSNEFLEGVAVTTTAGENLFREGVVVSDPIQPDERQRVADGEAFTADSGEREFTHVVATITSIGDTIMYTPAPGKRVRLRWIYAINDPTASTAPIIKVSLGAEEKYRVYALSKRQKVTGPVDGALVINLSAAGNVQVTALLEEV